MKDKDNLFKMTAVLIAIEVIREWNCKSLDDVVKEVEIYTDKKILQSDVDEYRFTGLNNIDFIKMRIK